MEELIHTEQLVGNCLRRWKACFFNFALDYHRQPGNYVTVSEGGLRIRIRIVLGSWVRIRTCIRVKSRIRISIKVKTQEFESQNGAVKGREL